MLLVSISYRNQSGDGTRSMTRSDVERERRIPESEFHAVGGNHIFLGHLSSGSFVLLCKILLHIFPIRFGHDDVRMVGVLEVSCSQVMIGVSVADDHIFN